jgi:hypothetical protein
MKTKLTLIPPSGDSQYLVVKLLEVQYTSDMRKKPSSISQVFYADSWLFSQIESFLAL